MENLIAIFNAFFLSIHAFIYSAITKARWTSSTVCIPRQLSMRQKDKPLADVALVLHNTNLQKIQRSM